MIKTTWVDPVTNKEYSYGWGYDTSQDATRMPAEFYNRKETNEVKHTMDYKDYRIKQKIEYNKIASNRGYFNASLIVDLSDSIEDVIHNDPATIIFWKDGTKTVVKCQENDEYSPTVGFAMAVCKKVFGNKGHFNEVFKKWVPEYDQKAEPMSLDEFFSLMAMLGRKSKGEE
jgi:hypothetical protein